MLTLSFDVAHHASIQFVLCADICKCHRVSHTELTTTKAATILYAIGN